MPVLRGTLASPPVQGVTVQDPVDAGAPTGYGVVAANGAWYVTPSPNVVIAALGTLGVGATATIDWTLAGYYTMTLAASSTNVLTFTNAAGVFTPSLGQVLRLRVTGGGAALTFPTGTFNFVAPSVALTTTAPTMTGTTTWDFTLICTGTGSAPTFDVSYIVS